MKNENFEKIHRPFEFSMGFRKVVLKEGRELKDISRFLYFIVFPCGVMLINYLILWR
jgi:hypothetical protein